MSTLTAAEAEQIAAKLNATLENRRGHKVAYVWWQGRIIATYGIRRSSGEVGHDYIPRQLFITMREALNLARCPLSKEEFFKLLKARSKLPIIEVATAIPKKNQVPRVTLIRRSFRRHLTPL
jgi:hypothetical protein